MARTARTAAQPTPGNGLDGLEQQLWATADSLRGHLDAADYKHVVLGLIFLKYISDAFGRRCIALLAEEELRTDLGFGHRRG